MTFLTRSFCAVLLCLLLPVLSAGAAEQIRFEPGIQGLPRQLEGNLVRDKEGFLWFCYYGGVARYDGVEVKYYGTGPGSVSGAATMSIAVDTKGRIWILTKDNGLNRYDKKSDTFTWYTHNPDDPHSIASNSSENFCPQRLAIHSRGHVLVGTDAGLDILDPETGRFTHHRHDPDNPDSISSNNITAVLEAPDGKIWAGTAGGGLNSLDPATGKWTRYTHDPNNPASISSNIVWSLLADRDGGIWAGT
ncbi:MAG: hypothetical protein MI802_02130, partial [Desulfobacterales bacterium]|nr:hypothetical protein [Desulfobacterales bacterium]